MKFFFGELYKILLEIASALVKFLARFCLDFGNRNRITPWFIGISLMSFDQIEITQNLNIDFVP